jgi:hypothetical protein
VGDAHGLGGAYVGTFSLVTMLQPFLCSHVALWPVYDCVIKTKEGTPIHAHKRYSDFVVLETELLRTLPVRPSLILSSSCAGTYYSHSLHPARLSPLRPRTPAQGAPCAVPRRLPCSPPPRPRALARRRSAAPGRRRVRSRTALGHELVGSKRRINHPPCGRARTKLSYYLFLLHRQLYRYAVYCITYISTRTKKSHKRFLCRCSEDSN